jgi:predicted TIM-barrel fold metal-dependent hydrolase
MKKIAELVQDMGKGKKNYDFFDINCWIPYNKNDSFSKFDNMEEYLSALYSFGVKCAVISNERGFSCNPFIGNEEILALANEYKNIYVGAVLAPEIGFVQKNMRGYIDKLVEQKVVLVRMFPKKLNYSLKKWQVGDILEYLEYKRFPLMIWHTETDWDTINEVCAEYPELPVIIEGNDKKLIYYNRAYIALMTKHKNLYIETHNFVQYLGYEYVVGELGINRLIYGSYFPYNSPNSSMLPIMTANINHSEKCNISGGNLLDLVRNIRH